MKHRFRTILLFQFKLPLNAKQHDLPYFLKEWWWKLSGSFQSHTKVIKTCLKNYEAMIILFKLSYF